MTRILTPWAAHLEMEGRTFDPHPDEGTYVFPDGEVYVRLEDLEDLEEATVVHSGWQPNAGLTFLYGALELLREHGVDADVAFSYMPYARQDTEHHGNDLNHARAIIRQLVEYHGVGKVTALDAHCSGRDWLEEYPYEDVSAVDALMGAIDLDDPLVVGPDLGASERFDIEGYQKQRRSARDVDVTGELDVAGQDVVVLDDMIATGGTLCAAHDRLKEQGAEQVVAAAVHGVLEEGVDRVRETYDALYLADTIPNEAADVTAGPVLASALDQS